MSMNNDLQEPLLERLSATPERELSPTMKKLSKKRKRAPDQDQAPKKATKKAKDKKANPTGDGALDTEAGINIAFSHMDSQLLADYIAQRTRKYESDLSSIELEDKYLPSGHPSAILYIQI
jgi:protein CMS1